MEVSAIGVALGLDAFGVGLSLGLDRRITKKLALLFVISFGFFQYFFVFIGGLVGNFFNTYIFAIPNVIGGIIILLVGILMFKEGLSQEEKFPRIHLTLIFILGICVSIDALVVGFSSFNIFYLKEVLFKNSIIVGFITAFLTGCAFIISKHIRKVNFVKEYAEFLGGIILILFGLKMIFL
ncbi:MAG: hypothetical protein FH761_10540 [Firmicutes bacterium]|nr:hypothetical protein [Bacillota bacterium]